MGFNSGFKGLKIWMQNLAENKLKTCKNTVKISCTWWSSWFFKFLPSILRHKTVTKDHLSTSCWIGIFHEWFNASDFLLIYFPPERMKCDAGTNKWCVLTFMDNIFPRFGSFYSHHEHSVALLYFLECVSEILCFFDRPSLYNLVNKANFVHNFP